MAENLLPSVLFVQYYCTYQVVCNFVDFQSCVIASIVVVVVGKCTCTEKRMTVSWELVDSVFVDFVCRGGFVVLAAVLGMCHFLFHCESVK